MRNVVGTVVVQATFEVANAILLFATLSFLGLGPPPPAANWGGMLTDGLNYVFDGYWWLIYPAGLCIVITVVAFNLIGDAIRNSLEVRLRKVAQESRRRRKEKEQAECEYTSRSTWKASAEWPRPRTPRPGRRTTSTAAS